MFLCPKFYFFFEIFIGIYFFALIFIPSSYENFLSFFQILLESK